MASAWTYFSVRAGSWIVTPWWSTEHRSASRRRSSPRGHAHIIPTSPASSESGFLTNESVFELVDRPRRLAVIGGGPIGCELAQAFRRLGSDVTLLHTGRHILNREDADAAEIVQRAFVDEGIRLVLGARLARVERGAGGKVLHAETPGGPVNVTVDEILVGAGRVPNVEGLGLEAGSRGL